MNKWGFVHMSQGSPLGLDDRGGFFGDRPPLVGGDTQGGDKPNKGGTLGGDKVRQGGTLVFPAFSCFNNNFFPRAKGATKFLSIFTEF